MLFLVIVKIEQIKRFQFYEIFRLDYIYDIIHWDKACTSINHQDE